MVSFEKLMRVDKHVYSRYLCFVRHCRQIQALKKKGAYIDRPVQIDKPKSISGNTYLPSLFDFE